MTAQFSQVEWDERAVIDRAYSRKRTRPTVLRAASNRPEGEFVSRSEVDAPSLYRDRSCAPAGGTLRVAHYVLISNPDWAHYTETRTRRPIFRVCRRGE